MSDKNWLKHTIITIIVTSAIWMGCFVVSLLTAALLATFLGYTNIQAVVLPVSLLASFLFSTAMTVIVYQRVSRFVIESFISKD